MVIEKMEKQKMEIVQIVLTISMEKIQLSDKNLFIAGHSKTFS